MIYNHNEWISVKYWVLILFVELTKTDDSVIIISDIRWNAWSTLVRENTIPNKFFFGQKRDGKNVYFLCGIYATDFVREENIWLQSVDLVIIIHDI